MAGLHEPRNPHPQIQGIAPGHDPPPGTTRESQVDPARNLSNPSFSPTL
jgi:hypothetical protein